MSPTATQPFNTRSFVSLVLAASGLGLLPTGLADHITQSNGASAVHQGWVLAHVALGALFIVFVVWHVALNRRALLKRIKGTARFIPISREAAWAAALVTVPLLFLVGHALAGG